MVTSTQLCIAATEKNALVIANSNYIESPLKNPVNDAKIVAAALSKAGFKTLVVNNTSRDQLFKIVKEFSESLKSDSIALVFYAGHGVQIKKNNYLLPINIKLTNDIGIQSDAYPVDHLIERLNRSKSAVNILVLDACRNNPFQNNHEFRGPNSLGLHEVVSPRGMLVAYSTQPGTLALDGSGENSIYAKAFAGMISKKGLTIEQIFNRIAQVVRKETDDLQQPIIESSIVDQFYFQPPVGVEMVPTNYNRKIVDIKIDEANRGITRETPKINSDFFSDQLVDWQDKELQLINAAKLADKLSVDQYIEKAKSGDVESQTILGIIYEQGAERVKDASTGHIYALSPNQVKSVYWLKKAAGKGYPIAQLKLGEKYALGEGVKVDKALSASLLHAANRVKFKHAEISLFGINGLVKRY